MSRTARSETILSADAIASTSIHIVGCGAIGSALALDLAQMGPPTLHLYDPDVVSPENLGVQRFAPSAIDTYKVSALGSRICELSPNTEVFGVCDYFPLDTTFNTDTDPILFLCTDSFESRRSIARAVPRHIPIIDGRVLGEHVEIFTRPTTRHHTTYMSSFPNSSEPSAAAGLPCTARMTIHATSHASSWMLAAFVRILRGDLPFRSITSNLATNLFTAEEFADAP